MKKRQTLHQMARKPLRQTVLHQAILAALATTPSFAWSDSCTGTVNSISGSTTEQCNLGAGESVQITASGSIAPVSTIIAITTSGNAGSIVNAGVVSPHNHTTIYNNFTLGDITNSGTINAVTVAIHNGGSGTMGTITNTSTGVISSTGEFGIINNHTMTAISNSGTISATGGPTWGTITNDNNATLGSLTNSGTITATNTTNGIAVINTSGSTINNFSNSGTITGGKYAVKNLGTFTNTITNGSAGTITSTSDHAIYNNGTLGGINNQGSITTSSSGSAIFNDGSGTVGNITNSGTVNGKLSGIFNASGGSVGVVTNSGIITGTTFHGIHNEGTMDSIVNSGTITGASGQYAILNNGTITNGITNTGTLDGLVELSGATLNLNGNAGRITGAVTGTGSTVNVNGTFTTEGTFNVDTFNIASSGKLNMANTITTASGFNNHGKLSVSSGTTATISGDYVQNGTLSIGASSTGNYGKLSVTGAATLNSGAKIDVNVASINTLANRETLSGVLTANTLTNNAGTLTVTDNSALLDFTATVNNNQIDLGVVYGGNIVTSVNHTGLNPGVGAANVLDGFIRGSGTGTDLDNVVNKLETLGTEKALSNAVAQTLPLMTAGMSQVSTNALHGTNRVIQARQEGNHGMSSGDEFFGDKEFWLKPVGSWTNQDNRKGVAGYSADTYGLVGGADGEINDATRIGMAFSYMNSNVDGKSTSSGNSADIDAYQAITYGSHDLANIENASINWQADIGTNKNKGRRFISFMNRTAKADYDSYTAHIGVGAGRLYQLNDKTTITPGIRADYTWIHDVGYTETGAGALNLKVKGQSTDELIVLAEGKLTYRLTDKATFLANAGVGYDFLNGENSLTASYVGGGASFTTKGLDASPWLARSGLGLVVSATERMEVTARYDLEARQDFLDQTASLKLRWNF